MILSTGKFYKSQNFNKNNRLFKGYIKILDFRFQEGIPFYDIELINETGISYHLNIKINKYFATKHFREIKSDTYSRRKMLVLL
jgi:hypothetical protein